MYGMVSGLNATDKMPMYEMPLTLVLGGWGFGESIFCVGVYKMQVSMLDWIFVRHSHHQPSKLMIAEVRTIFILFQAHALYNSAAARDQNRTNRSKWNKLIL